LLPNAFFSGRECPKVCNISAWVCIERAYLHCYTDPLLGLGEMPGNMGKEEEKGKEKMDGKRRLEGGGRNLLPGLKGNRCP